MLPLAGGHNPCVFCSQGGVGVFVGQESQSGCDGDTLLVFVPGFAVYLLHLITSWNLIIHVRSLVYLCV